MIGESAERNTRGIQRHILPQLEKWEKESGAVFGTSKTVFITFTRSMDSLRDSDMPLQFKQDRITPDQSIKILGVTMERVLRYKEHIANKAEKAFKVALAVEDCKG